MRETLSQLLLKNAAGFRCGVTLNPQQIENSFADIAGIFSVSLPEDSAQFWKSASGCNSFVKAQAVSGAIAEAMERYAAAVVRFPIKKLAELNNEHLIPHDQFALFSAAQYQTPNFLWPPIDEQQAYFGEVYSLYDNERVWVPQELIGLGSKAEQAQIPSTSTGLAAHTNKYRALLSALQELLERDALTVYWLNALGGREIELPEKYHKLIETRNGEAYCFDITQQWNPYPVIIVCGYLTQRNKRRYSMGVACRDSYESAIEKAFLEWNQGMTFAGFYDLYHPDLVLDERDKVIDFDAHAVYYTLYPRLWPQLPLIKDRFSYKPQMVIENSRPRIEDMLESLCRALMRVGVRLYYRDLTLPDLRDAGLTVVRVLSPELSLIHGDERAPFLGGRTNDVAWRYPEIKYQREKFPNRFPHPLG